jgi:hypothetical protein
MALFTGDREVAAKQHKPPYTEASPKHRAIEKIAVKADKKEKKGWV